MDTVHSVATLYRVSPFEILNSDIEDFILILNYLIEKGEGTNKVKTTAGRDPMWDLL